MEKEELIEYLKQNLKISVDTKTQSYVGTGIEIKLYLEDEKISSDYIITKYWGDD
jgi:hypothetical protein